MTIVLARPMRATASAAIRSLFCVECTARVCWPVSKELKSTARIEP